MGRFGIAGIVVVLRFDEEDSGSNMISGKTEAAAVLALKTIEPISCAFDAASLLSSMLRLCLLPGHPAAMSSTSASSSKWYSKYKHRRNEESVMMSPRKATYFDSVFLSFTPSKPSTGPLVLLFAISSFTHTSSNPAHSIRRKEKGDTPKHREWTRFSTMAYMGPPNSTCVFVLILI